MSAVTKNLRVHFDDDLPTAWKAEPCITKLDQNQNTATVFKYSRDELLELKKHSIHEPEKLFNDIQAADEKRKEKIKFVFRKEKVLKLFNNPSKFIPKSILVSCSPCVFKILRYQFGFCVAKAFFK